MGCVSGELGLCSYLDTAGRELIVTSHNVGPNSEFERMLPDVEVVMFQLFWPAYLTKERSAKAQKVSMCVDRPHRDGASLRPNFINTPKHEIVSALWPRNKQLRLSK